MPVASPAIGSAVNTFNPGCDRIRRRDLTVPPAKQR
jgi:hypothetical protein